MKTRVYLAGVPNAGKSTLFNLMTGLNQRVGNWPGTTVERREGFLVRDGLRFEVLDLPGTAALTAESPEEQIARDVLIKARDGVVVAVLNAAQIERGLYFLAELAELQRPVVVVLNMMDVARSEGVEVEPGALEDVLGVPVIPMVARRGQGLADLLRALTAVARGDRPARLPVPLFPLAVRDRVDRVAQLLDGLPDARGSRVWMARKVLEGDRVLTCRVMARLPEERRQELVRFLLHNEDLILKIVSARYTWVHDVVRACVRRHRRGQVSWTERLDRVATHPVAGFLVFLGVMAALLGLVFAVGLPLQAWLDAQWMAPLAAWVRGQLGHASPLLASFLADGLIGGVGLVLTFLPILAVFFLAMGVLEDVGYMTRAAYVMDRFMHVMGLHGKSFLPLFLGFGCNVPAVMGSRVIENRRARILTVLITPFVPCSARLVVLTFFAAAFFGGWAPVFTLGILAATLGVMVGVALVLNRVLFQGRRDPLIMELPLYHMPYLRGILQETGRRMWAFVRRAGTWILAMSLVIWGLAHVPHGDMETSLLAGLGRRLEPLGRWMGLDWRALVALFTSVVVKENSLATLGILSGAASDGARLVAAVRAMLSPAAAVAFIVVQMLFVPCIATLTTLKMELVQWRWTLLSLGMQLVLSFGLGILVYQTARFLGVGV